LRYRSSNFDELIQHQIQALIFGYLFIKKKVGALRRLAEARNKAVVRYQSLDLIKAVALRFTPLSA